MLQSLAVVIAEDFRRESRIFGGRAESQMELGGAAAHHIGRFKVSAHHLMHVRRRVKVAELEGMTVDLRSGVFGFAARQSGFEKLAQRVEGVAPGVTLIFDEGMKRGDDGAIAVRSAIFNRSGERRRVRELPLGKESAHFHFGMNARLDAAVQLEQKTAAIHDCGIAVLGGKDGRAEFGVTGAPGFAESAGVGADELAHTPSKAAAARDGPKQRIAEGGIPESTIHYAL